MEKPPPADDSGGVPAGFHWFCLSCLSVGILIGHVVDGRTGSIALAAIVVLGWLFYLVVFTCVGDYSEPEDD